MIKSIGILLCCYATVAYGNPYESYEQYPTKPKSSLSFKCSQASQFLKNNNCGPSGCDIGLCVALQHGCRINNWGHVCPYPYPYTIPQQGTKY
jgi:hypothetical protein